MSAKSVTISDYRTQIPGEFNKSRTRWSFPQLKSINSRGKERTWEIYIEIRDDDGKKRVISDKYYSEDSPYPVHIYTCTGEVDGQQTTSDPTIVRTGKNKGKKNATTNFTQALRDALGMYNKQKTMRDKTKEKAAPVAADKAEQQMIPPMLLQDYFKQKKPFNWAHGAIVQPKFDGIRGSIIYPHRLYSRKLKTFDNLAISDLEANLRDLSRKHKGIMFDGEIYAEGASLQAINRAARGDNPRGLQLKFYIFDIYCPAKPELTAEARIQKLMDMKDAGAFAAYPAICLAEWRFVRDETELNTYYQELLRRKYEGAVIRIPSGVYKPSYGQYRSSSILKMKPIKTDEYMCDAIEMAAKGSHAGAIKYICYITDPANPDNRLHFKVTPKGGSVEGWKAEYQRLMEKDARGVTLFDRKYKDKIPVTLEYREKSEDGIPQHAKMVAWRDYE